MSENRVSIRSEAEFGACEVILTFPHGSELFQRILDYALEQARLSASQLPLPLPGVNTAVATLAEPAAESTASLYCHVEGCEKEPHPQTGYCLRCMRAIREIEAARAAEKKRLADDADEETDPPGPDADRPESHPQCKAPDCTAPATKSTGFCRARNRRDREAAVSAAAAAREAAKGGNLCAFPGCDEPLHKAGRCYQHYKADEMSELICATADCPGGATPAGLCAACMKVKDAGGRPSARAGKGAAGE